MTYFLCGLAEHILFVIVAEFREKSPLLIVSHCLVVFHCLVGCEIQYEDYSSNKTVETKIIFGWPKDYTISTFMGAEISLSISQDSST
jgi:hypothetical protein